MKYVDNCIIEKFFYEPIKSVAYIEIWWEGSIEKIYLHQYMMFYKNLETFL